MQCLFFYLAKIERSINLQGLCDIMAPIRNIYYDVLLVQTRALAFKLCIILISKRMELAN